nr:GntR family transcriptional regulator [Listeria aquatica]
MRKNNEREKNLYLKKIADELKEKIEREEYKPGMLMPSEKELQSLFSSSRTTIRRAVDLLVAEKLVIRKNGVGLYVEPKLTTQNILEMTGVMKSGSAESAVREIKDFYMRKAGKFYAQKFGIKENELLYFIRLLQKNKDAHQMEILLLPLSLYPDLRVKDLQIVSILELVNSGRQALFALEQELQLVKSTQEQMKYLQIDEDTPVVKLSTVYYDDTNSLVAVGYRYENAMLTEYMIDFN